MSAAVPSAPTRQVGLTMLDIAEGRIATLEEMGVAPQYHTPLSRLIVEDVQTQCGKYIQEHARAMVLGVHHVTPRDLRHRAQVAGVCQMLAMQRYSKHCQKQVLHFQQTLADAEQEPDVAMKKEMLAEASGRLKWCARLPQLPSEFAIDDKSRPLPYYFKANDGAIITQAQLEKKKADK